MKTFGSRWHRFLQNPAWYVAIVTVLAGLTFQVRFLWWLAGMVALVWGIWLVWQLFDKGKTEVGSQDHWQTYLAQTLIYRAQIDQALRATSNKSNRAHRRQLAVQIDIWAKAIQDLVQRIASLRQDDLIRREMATVPKAIEDLETQLINETDAAIRTQLERTLINRKNQLASLELLHRIIKRTEIQIENTLSLFGTLYSQLLTGQSTSHVADYARLSADVDEEVHRLQDQLEALREVKEEYICEICG